MPNVLWGLYFIQEQGYNMTHALIYQDNKSAILLETNGKMSSSSRTKHIKSKFFFITDKVEQGEAEIEYKPTGQMWIDINTKPKCGTPYKTDRALMMNCDVDIPDETLPSRPVSILRSNRSNRRLQECVGVRSNPATVRTVRSETTHGGLAKRLATSIASAAARVI